MRRLFLSVIALCGLAASSDAAILCTSPQEMKVLQAAALQQQLMAAAQSCHFAADYSRFVSSFGSAIVKSDRALKAFFQRRKEAEGYNGYKARIAKTVSLSSLHDPRFCPSAKLVFDMAFKRGNARKSPAPSLVRTGYEGCRPLPAKPLMAANPPPVAKPVLAVAQLVPAVPVPRAAPRPALRTVLPEKPVKLLAQADAPRSRTIFTAAASRPAETAKPSLPPAPGNTVSASRYDPQPELQAEQPVQRVAVAQRPRWRPVERRPEPRSDEDWNQDDPYDPIPNAYRPGAYWVADEPTPPRRRRAPARMAWSQDGRWFAVFRWQDD
jgi:hypothetical protein